MQIPVLENINLAIHPNEVVAIVCTIFIFLFCILHKQN